MSLTRPNGFGRGSSLDIKLPEKYFNISGLLNGDSDGSLSEIVDLNIYYETDSKDVSKEISSEYKEQKEIALQINEIYNKAKNDTYTKEVLLRFGLFDFEVLEDNILDPEYGQEEGQLSLDTKEESKFVSKKFYLFSLPVRIEKEIDTKGIDKYLIVPVDFEVRLNLTPLYEIFRSYKKEELVYEFLNEYVKLEEEGGFSIPILDHKIFVDTWHFLKAKLRLTDASFNEESFTLNDLRLTLSPRSNFFLVEDLTKLSRENESVLEGTSLSSWFSEDGLNVNTEPSEEKNLYFPFPYDRYQRATTSLLNNKASIIQGPPGTGKSETISNIISHLVANKNKVLFVSQKAQALRVVKEKLKTLNVPLLFGYIPSVKLEESLEEESDTISSQLSSLDTYIHSDQRQGKRLSVESFAENKETLLGKMDRIIDIERNIFSLREEESKLSYLNDLPGFDEEKILVNLTEDLFNSYSENQKKLAEVNFTIKKLEGISGDFLVDRDLFIEVHFSEKIKEIISDVKKTGFDGSFILSKHLNNLSRKIRLNTVFHSLPKEVRFELDQILSKNKTRHSTIKALERFFDFCLFHESLHEKESLENLILEIETNLDLSCDDFSKIKNFLIENNLTFSDLIIKLTEQKNLRDNIFVLIEQKDSLKKEVVQKSNLTRKEIVANYLANIVQGNIKENILNIKIFRKLQELQKAFKKSKKAFKTFDKLKSDSTNFQTILNIVPVWIMDLDDASRLIPLVPNLFDYVIFDEASQCNIAYTIPAMFRAKKTIFVGDPEQMRDTTIMFKSNQSFDQLASRYRVPESLQIKPTGSSVQSVLDIAKTRFGIPKILQYHYRSPKELIDFSNKYFYEPKGKRLIALNNKYLTYKDTNKVMVIHDVNYDGVGETSDSTNRAEAIKARDLYLEMSTDSRYSDKSFAILSFFNDQAELIRKVFEEKRIKENDKLKISIIEGIQGDEKDVIIYSFVISDPSQKRQYIPLTGETGDIRADINAGRVNVAFSRARYQVHCLVSLPIEKIPSGIWIKKYLEYVRDNGEVSFSDSNLEDFDSYFEEEFYHLAKKKFGKKYKIQNQVKSCGFKIDFVVTNLETSSQIAVECDGPTHFKDHIDESYGIYVDSDIQRQLVLESAGWKFFRIGYSEWIKDDENKEQIINELKSLV